MAATGFMAAPGRVLFEALAGENLEGKREGGREGGEKAPTPFVFIFMRRLFVSLRAVMAFALMCGKLYMYGARCVSRVCWNIIMRCCW